jgi:hypothetical protein
MPGRDRDWMNPAMPPNYRYYNISSDYADFYDRTDNSSKSMSDVPMNETHFHRNENENK